MSREEKREVYPERLVVLVEVERVQRKGVRARVPVHKRETRLHARGEVK